MPKAAPKDFTTRRHTRSAKKGRTKQTDAAGTSSTGAPATSTSATGTSASNDPSQWRSSRLRDSDTITRTDAKQLYRLKKEGDLEGIPFETRSTVVRGEVRTMYIYKERDVERRAWERNGGPEGFESYLAELREKYIKKYHSDAHFPQPRTYQDRRAQVSISHLEPEPGPFDFYGVGKSPTLLRIKERMVPWVWVAYNKALWSIDVTDEWSCSSFGAGPDSFAHVKNREGPMKDALVMMPTYPPRPAELLAPSPSVDEVRAVLADAPKLPSEKEWGRDVPGLTFRVSQYDEYGDPASFKYRWSEEYLDRLFTALIEVVEEHGTGPEGFEGIRWEVYDKYVDSWMGGPHYHEGRKMWTGDTAAEWLDGQFASVEDTYRAECPAGQQFNDMLPRLHPQGERSVGVRPR